MALIKLQYFSYRTAARVWCKCDYMAPALEDKHWLSVQKITDNKVLLLTYKTHQDEPVHSILQTVSVYIYLKSKSQLWSDYGAIKAIPIPILIIIVIVVYGYVILNERRLYTKSN